ncbi:hypothetical protein [Enterococcus mediterraneensis]|uniref:hypothetical protein n=1 Tax=Enterococcus mediterraneensis TaxID=2364791 RepID=UPI001F14D2BB|nr:hypothetical protein [Enterococcus mediterraneensis]
MKARKKPVIVDVVLADDWKKVKSFVGESFLHDPLTDSYGIKTLEGVMRISPGDYIIKGVEGEFYSCKPDIFHKTYDILKEVDLSIDPLIGSKQAAEQSLQEAAQWISELEDITPFNRLLNLGS